jgi:ribosomal protein uL13
MMVINGDNCVLGRIATAAAKAALGGEEVRIVNAEKILITGNPATTIAMYRARLGRKDVASPWKSPKISRRPDLFVRRAIRGMLPRKSRRGAAALKRIIAYMGEPEEFRGKAKKVEGTDKPEARGISIREVCEALGWRGMK